VGTVVDDRRHSQVVNLAKAISVRDLREQVKTRSPEDAPIPSKAYVHPVTVSTIKENNNSSRAVHWKTAG